MKKGVRADTFFYNQISSLYLNHNKEIYTEKGTLNSIDYTTTVRLLH